MPRFTCWRPWRHRPHVVLGADLGYEGFVDALCTGHNTKRDFRLTR